MSAGVSGCNLVLHGPEVIYSGDAARLVGALRPARVVVAGVMGRCAAEEHGLLSCWTGARPSAALQADPLAVLANRGRSPESGRIFCEGVAARLRRPLVQLECADRTVVGWNGGDGEPFARRLGWTLEDRTTSLPAAAGNRRLIRGCRPGDAVLVNGLMVGRATADEVVLVSDGEGIVAERGCMLKEHGIEKLRRRGPIALPGAWCTAGSLRAAPPVLSPQWKTAGRVLVLDHDAVALYDGLADDLCGLLAIGDDTTGVALHLGGHLGLPVLGITDGDGDMLLPECRGAPGSLVLQAIEGRDNDLGREIADRCDGRTVEWEAFVAGARRALGGRVRVIG